MRSAKYDYRIRFAQTRSVVGWSLRLGWAYHKAYWQGCWPNTASEWTYQRSKELKNLNKELTKGYNYGKRR